MLSYKKSKNEIVFLVIIFLSVILGFYFRIKGLSYGGFSSSDEYYMAKSIHNILKYGIPKFPLGGYYDRGLIYQYLSAFLLTLGIKEVFALRIIPLLFNMLALPAVYLLGKKSGSKIIAISILILFCFSAWEVEFARLARYYAPFQTMFIWYILFLYKNIIEKDVSSFKWMLILSAASIFMYEGSIFLILLNFLPFILRKENFSWIRILLSVGIFLLAFIYLRFDFWHMGVTNYLPTNVQFIKENSFAPIDIPYLFIITFPNLLWYVLFIIPAILCIIYGFYLFRVPNDLRPKIIFTLVAILSLFNLFAVGIILLIILYLIRWIRFQDIKSKNFYLLISVMFFNFIFYLIYGLTTTSWLRFFPEESSISINKIFWVFINYPNFYEKIARPWFFGMPYLTVILLLFIGIGFILNAYKSKFEINNEIKGADILLAILILIVSIVASLKMPYNDTRYTFFIYPLFMLVFLLSVNKISEILSKSKKYHYAIYFFVLAFFVIFSSDYSINHLVNIDTKEIHFRTIYNHERATIYFFRNDYVTPAEVINKNMNDSDIVVTTQAPIEYYLKRLDYYYRNYKDGEFTGRSRLGGKREVWTGAKLIYKENDLLNLLDSTKSTIWLSDFSDKRFGHNPFEAEINKKYKKYLYYVNLDSTINVYKIYQQR